MSFFQIPGNIKQQFAPFVLVPGAELHKPKSSSTSVTGSPQYFTYKNKEGDYPSGLAKINFYPSSLDAIQIKDDISFKLLYARNNSLPEYMTSNSITISDILNTIPGIQIREFLPDTRLDQCINFFKNIIESMSEVFKKDGSKSQENSGQSQSTDQKSEVGLFEKITAVSKYTIKYMVGKTDPNFYTDLHSLDKIPFSSYKYDVYSNIGDAKKSPGFYVMTFPYTLYYRLQSCVTTNIYEIPAASSDKMIMHSSGMSGWTDGGDDIMSSGGFRLSNLLGKIPGIGNLANMILGNIGVNYMPWWNAGSGAKTKEPQIEITFDLYNDNVDSALYNFIFVNTLVPNNRWIQYNMFQHSSCLYDVKIEGINRLFACAGDFTVTYEGVLRNPPYEFYNKLRAKFNKNMEDWTFYINCIDNKLIKIPDVYRVKLSFQSLLPANFNNFIFNYAENASHITKYANKVYDPSTLSEALPGAIGKYVQRVAKVWETGKESAGATVK